MLRFRRSLATCTYSVGQQIQGYTVQQVTAIPELSITAVKLYNEKARSQHLHLDSKDTNNVFAVAFKTNAPDGTGLPHILEHLVLCGSEKFPVRDPFFKMTNRSLSNFMNAMTGHDFTYYPFATTNKKDYENLMDVYLSSVFLPTLTPSNFSQEGWRLEHETHDDSSSPIIYKGVVYNEMKGQNSNTDYFFYKSFLEAIYPALNNSGGNPESIPNLTHAQMREYYRNTYHPGNSRTFTYGNFPLEGHLQKIREYFDQVSDRQNGAGEVKYPVFSEGVSDGKAIIDGPVDVNKPIDQQYKGSITWNLGNALDERNEYTVFLWKVLSSLLIDGHSAPFYRELIEADLADDFSPNVGVDVTTALLSFTMGLNNCRQETLRDLEGKVIGILEKTAADFEADNTLYKDRVTAILHQIELNLKRHKPDFGLNLLNSLVPSWVNNADPVRALQLEQMLTRFKNDWESNGLRVFSPLLQNIIDGKADKFTFVMRPKEDFNDMLIKDEEARLARTVKSLSKDELAKVYEDGLKLAKEQQTESDASILPSLSVADIPVMGDKYPVSYNSNNDVDIQRRVVDTNGLVYVTESKRIAHMPTEYYKYLSLFTSCLTNLAGTRSTSIHDLETRISKSTGGIFFNVKSVVNPYNLQDVDLRFVASGSSLAHNAQHIYNLWHEILTETRFDSDPEVVDKLYQLIKNMCANQLNTISDRGHSYANWAGDAHLTVNKHITDQLSGLTNIEFVADLLHQAESKGKQFLADEVLPILADIQRLLLVETPRKFRIVGDSQIVSQNESLIGEYIGKKGKSESISQHLDTLVKSFKPSVSSSTLINLPFQVGHASLAKLGAPYVSPDGAALQVLAQLYTFKHLHSVIRESNSAYGGGMLYDGLGGTINFYSYRDPNPLKSVQSFKDCFDYGLRTSWDPSDLEQAKLRIFQSIDAPMSVSSQGSSEFHEGITDEMRQQRREHFLGVGENDISRVIEKYLIPGENIVSVIGNNDVLGVGKEWRVRNMRV